MRYYNGLSVESKRTFRPLGTETDLTTARAICRANHDERPERYDLVVMHGDEIAGWCFVWDLDKESPQLGLGIADAHQQRGLGRCLITALLDWARRQALTRIGLIAVEDNVAALRLYESCGFRITGRRHDERDGLDYHEMTVDLTNKPEET
jgi:RimJ/RimL family protein N-acetyltransferase